MSIKQIDGYKIQMNSMLGSGSFGAVYSGISDTTKQKVAIKIMKKSSGKHYVMQSIPMSTSKMHFSPRSRSCRKSSLITLWAFWTSWRVTKITILCSNCAMETFCQSSSPENVSLSLRLRDTFFRSAMGSLH